MTSKTYEYPRKSDELALLIARHFWSNIATAIEQETILESLSERFKRQNAIKLIGVHESIDGDAVKGFGHGQWECLQTYDGTDILKNVEYRITNDDDDPRNIDGNMYLFPHFMYWREPDWLYVSERYGPRLKRRCLYKIADGQVILYNIFPDIYKFK